MISITLTQLEYICAIARHGHFGRAAKACFISQPTLSMQVQKLEDQLGVLLFDRSKKPIEPTPIGLRIVEQARATLQEAALIPEIIAGEKGTLEGDFKLGTIPTLAPYLLPLFLKSFIDRYPGVNLTIEETQTVPLIEKLNDDRLDAGLLVTPVHHRSIVERPLFLEAFVVYMNPEHPLAIRRALSEKDLNRDDIWLLNEGHCFREQALQICGETLQSKTRRTSLEFESGNLETLKRLVDTHSGYTLLPQLATLTMSPEDKKKYLRPFKAPAPKREVSLASNRACVKTRILNALAEEILSCLPGEFTRPTGNEKVVPIPSLT